jgi:hypothetical protein
VIASHSAAFLFKPVAQTPHHHSLSQSVVVQFPDTHLAMLTGDGGARLAHILEMLSYHFRDLAFSSSAKDGIFSIVQFFKGLAALVPKPDSPAAVLEATNALRQNVLPHVIKLCVECFTRDQVYLLLFLCSNPSLDIRNHVVKHTTIAESVFEVLGNLLLLPSVAAQACDSHVESLKRLLQALTSIDDLDDLAQVPLAAYMCNALISLGSVLEKERAAASGPRPVQAVLSQSLLPEAARTLEQLCSCDSIIVFAVARLLCVWLEDETVALALTRMPPTEGLLKVIRYLGNPNKTALRYQDRWVLRIVNSLLKHSHNYAIADFLCVSAAYELMVTINGNVRAVGSSDGWPSLVLAIDVARRIIGYGSKAASVVCDRLDDGLGMLMRTLRSLVATADEISKKKMAVISVRDDDAVFIASLVAAMASHVSADPVIARTFRGCEEIESVLVTALETNVEDLAMRRYLLHALASLVLANRGHAEQVCNVNNRAGVRVICKMLRHADRNIHAHAAVVLSQLVTYVPSCVNDMRDAGGFTDLLDKLAVSDQSDLSRLALVRLLVRLSTVEQAVMDLIDRDIIQMLVGFLSRFQGQTTNVRYTMYYELGVLRAFMNMCAHKSVRLRLLDSPLLDALRKIRDELPSDLMSLEGVYEQLQSSGNEEDGMEAFLTNPRILSDLSEMMKKNLQQVDSHMLEDHKSRVRHGQRTDRHLGKDKQEKLATQFMEMVVRIEDMPKTTRGLEIAMISIASLLEDQLSAVDTAEMYREPTSATLSPQDQRRFALAQARSLNQLIALLGNLPMAENYAAQPRARLRLMISYNWGVVRALSLSRSLALSLSKSM